MAEENNAEKQFGIQKLYLKDVSFESPLAPQIFTAPFEPVVEFNLSSAAQDLQNDFYEVSLTITATVKNGDSTAYLVEVCQAGVFSVANFSDQEMNHMLGSFCLSILYPYAREAVSDLVVKGGFPPLLLAPVNFDALHAQHLAQQGATPTLN